MSAYKNFIKDFPERCSEILAKYKTDATYIGKEVTLMLAIASAGFSVPYERIRPPSNDSDSTPQPSGDRERYREAAQSLDELLKGKFIGSTLCTNLEHSWCFGTLASYHGDPDCWLEMKNPKKVTKGKTIDPILKHLRNALAHGNIYTVGDQINRIIFLSKPCKGQNKFNYLSVSPDDFCSFLQGWFTFVKSLKLPVEVIGEN